MAERFPLHKYSSGHLYQKGLIRGLQWPMAAVSGDVGILDVSSPGCVAFFHSEVFPLQYFKLYFLILVSRDSMHK